MPPSPSPRAAHLLGAAIAFRARDVDVLRVPDTFADAEDVMRTMRSVLWHEAHSGMQEALPSPPDEPLFHPVDLSSSTPGIVSATAPRVVVHRVDEGTASDLVARARAEEKGAAAEEEEEQKGEVASASAVRSAPAATARGPTLEKKRKAALAKAERQARRDEEHDAEVLRKRAERQRHKEERANESKEERAERLAEARRAREEKKRAREEAAAAEEEEEGGHDPSGGGGDGGGDGGADGGNGGADGGGNGDDGKDDEPAPAPSRVDADAACTAAHHRLLPTRLRVVDSAAPAAYFANPVPLQRHLHALACARLPADPALASALLRGAPPTDALVVVQGPPGTGKTAELVRLLLADVRAGRARRALVAAHSNVAVANLYQRLLATDLADEVALCVAPDRVPADVVVASNDPSRRVVCATVSGRAGARLRAHAFDAVYLDEAAQCSEACAWTLMREEVALVRLAGDVRQLRARAASEEGRRCEHDRSLMERLVDVLAYPAVRLDVQRRMAAEVLRFPNRAFYGDALRSAVAADGSYRCLVVARGEAEAMGTSVRNLAEVDVCLREAERHRREAPDASVVVLCPYLAQCRAALARGTGVPVHSVDSFQGREADVVVLSIVRRGDACGFWEDARRLVVATTRARTHMVVVGGFDWTCGPLAELRADAERRGVLEEA